MPRTAPEPDEPTVFDHAYISGPERKCIAIVRLVGLNSGFGNYAECGVPARLHANPGDASKEHPINTHPHHFVGQQLAPELCAFTVSLHGDTDPGMGGVWRRCGYPEQLHKWKEYDDYMANYKGVSEEATNRGRALVRKADAAQYERPPMPDAARRGPVVTLIDEPVDPLGTLAVIGGIYKGIVARSKSEVTDEQRRALLADMQATVLNGPLESIQFTFLVEGVGRDITHQMVRNRFSFFAQESLRFAVAEDWAQEVPLPPSLASLPQDAPAVGVWRKALNQAEDSYAALIGAGMPAEEARKVLPHAITTRLYWTVSLRTLLQEAGKRTCTQAQFDWRQIFAGVAKALRERSACGHVDCTRSGGPSCLADGWQYTAFADLLRPVCYQQGKCGFMAKFDRGCTIRERVDANALIGRGSSQWNRSWVDIDGRDTFHVEPGVGYDDKGVPVKINAIHPSEWAADPAAARVREED